MFESSQRATLLSSSAERSGAARESFGEGGLWHRHTSEAVVTRTSTRTTSEEQLVGSGRGHQRGYKRDRSAESPHALEGIGSSHRASAADRWVAGGHGGAADTRKCTPDTQWMYGGEGWGHKRAWGWGIDAGTAGDLESAVEQHAKDFGGWGLWHCHTSSAVVTMASAEERLVGSSRGHQHRRSQCRVCRGGLCRQGDQRALCYRGWGPSPVLVTASLLGTVVSGVVPCILRHLAFVAPGVRDGTAFASAGSPMSHVTTCRADISIAVHSPLLYGLVR